MTAPPAPDRNALLARYAAGVDAVVDALAGATDGELDARPADGGWTAREVVHHLADSEARSLLRLRQLVAGSEPEIQPYDQDAWVERLPMGLPVDLALDVLRSVRAYSLATAATLAEGDWARAATHPEHPGGYTIDTWLALYAEHPHEHAAQIRAARAGAATG